MAHCWSLAHISGIETGKYRLYSYAPDSKRWNARDGTKEKETAEACTRYHDDFYVRRDSRGTGDGIPTGESVALASSHPGCCLLCTVYLCAGSMDGTGEITGSQIAFVSSLMVYLILMAATGYYG
jgi:hypothetical protein